MKRSENVSTPRNAGLARKHRGKVFGSRPCGRGSPMKKLSARELSVLALSGLFLSFLPWNLSWAEDEEAAAPTSEGDRQGVPEPIEPIVIPEATTPMLALDTVVAVVNGEAITLDELQRETNPVMEYWRNLLRREVSLREKERILMLQLEGIINRKLILMEAKELGARVEESSVRETILSIPELRRTYNGDLGKFLVAKGLTYRRLYEEIEEQLLFNGLIRGKVLPKVRVSPAEVEQYYQRNIQKYTEEAAIHCFAITFFKKENPESGAAVLTKAREALKKIREGAYFPDVAREYSEDPVRAEKGGDWGWITPGALEKKASDAAFALKEGEYSGIVDGDAAHWILWVKEKRDRSVIPLSAVWKEIELAIRVDKRDTEIWRWGRRLRRKAAITYPAPIRRILGM